MLPLFTKVNSPNVIKKHKNKTCFKVLVLVCLILARIGKDGEQLYFGSSNNEFLGKGVVVGYAIIVPAILLTYLLGANLTILVSLGTSWAGALI